MKYVLLIMCTLFLINGCTSRKQEINKLIKEWYNKKIIFPDSLEIKVLGHDTIIPDIFKAKYKILNYIDTNGCTACKMKLYDWKLLQRETKRLNINVSYIFAIWAKNYKAIDTMQQINYFDIPCIYDRKGDIKKSNNFPNEYQTFLLDSSNNVILLGNPIRNSKLWELYLKIIQQDIVLTDAEHSFKN